jgi:gliding motility-associated-like protein
VSKKRINFLYGILLFAASFLLAVNVSAQAVTNGSVAGAPAGNNVLTNAAGWTVCGFSPDLCSVAFPSYSGGSQVAPGASPDGGTWLGLAAVGAGECGQTSITGLTIGQNYTLCFYGANFGTGALFNASPSNPDVCVGATCQTYVIPQVAGVWTQFTLPFVATAATMTLSCNLTADNSYCGLDGFTISVPGGTAAWTDPSPLCSSQAPINLDALVTGTAGGTWSGTGVTGNTFDPSVGTQNVTYTVNPGTCNEVFMTINVVVSPGASAAWTVPLGICTGDAPFDLTPQITGTVGGVWSGVGMTGSTFDPSGGSQNITYTAGIAPCDDIVMQMITVNLNSNPAWTPPIGLCTGAAPIDLSSLITGDPGGTWSGIGVTGTFFDPSGGTQTITYDVGIAPCNGISTQVITVGANGNPAWTPPLGLCTSAAPIDLSTVITGDPGGTWSGIGVTGTFFDPSLGTQTITYDVGLAPCNGVSAQVITVTANGNAAWTPPINVCIGDAPVDLNTLITGTPGGSWSGTGVAGTFFDPSFGTQTITYSVGAVPCNASSAQSINVTAALNPAWSIPLNVCESDSPIDLTTFITGNTGGTWSGTGITGNSFDPSVGTQMITYTVGSGGCQAILTQSIAVNVAPNPAWTTITMCISSAPVNLTGQITGAIGGTWSGTGISGTVFDPFFGTQNVTYSVTSGSCVANSTQMITVLDPQIAMTAVNVSCFGLTDGSATATVTGGSGSQTYLWNPSGQTSQTAINLAAGSYQVTVTDGSCTAVDSITILEPLEILANLGGVNGCAPDKGSASVIASGGVGGFSYLWTPSGQTTAIATALDSAMHTVVITDANGCSLTDSVLVQIIQAPNIVAMADTTLIYPNCINLTATGGVSYTWTPDDDLDCGSCLSPQACPMIATTYCVTGVDVNGCVNSDCVLIDVEIVCGEVFVPSAFSPNNDGENDLECVYSDCIENITFTIYNRWGEKVFETNDDNICWDGTWKGKLLNSAVFVYVVDGNLINGETFLQKGNISLIR